MTAATVRCGKITNPGAAYPHPCVLPKGHDGQCDGRSPEVRNAAAANRYEVTVTRMRFGATADVGWYTDGLIGLQGPVFWRPTVRWVKRRADRHVARRLRMHSRTAAATREVIRG